MTKIQVLTNSSYKSDEYAINKLSSNDAFDSFDYNIIDLKDTSIWSNVGSSMQKTNLENDLLSLKNQINNSHRSKYIFVFPLNVMFHYNYNRYSQKYEYSIKLRDNIVGIQAITELVVGKQLIIKYESNKTNLGEVLIKSDFYFDNEYSKYDNVLLSIDSNKIVAFSINNFTFTTLDILNSGAINIFIDFLEAKSLGEYPSWFKTLTFNDDDELRKRVSINNESIEALSEENKNLADILEKNNYYKAILVETGDKLVKIIFDILQQLFNIDLSSFVDEKKLDFVFQMDGKIFGGEIKGVNEAIKRYHISQLEDNKQYYIEKESIDDCKGLLIINELRSKPPSEREKIHSDLVKYAEKDDILIITTKVLLDIYEAFLKKELDINKFKKIISNQSGILTDEWR